MPTIIFNGKEYCSDQIQKLIFSCHTEEVAITDILPSTVPEAKRSIAIKFNNKYQLLVGSIRSTKDMVKLACITKHALKKCELVEDVPEPEVPAFNPVLKDRYPSNRSIPPKRSNWSK